MSIVSDVAQSKCLFCIFVSSSPNGSKLYHLGGNVELFIIRYLHGFPDPILIAYSHYYAMLNVLSITFYSKCVVYGLRVL